jgi:hypothetical protein
MASMVRDRKDNDAFRLGPVDEGERKVFDDDTRVSE